jgi:hypothetical protein
MIEKQVIVQWYTPEEKTPPEGDFVVVTFSGKAKNVTYDHTFGIAEWYGDKHGWYMEGLPEDAVFTILAWADLEPYKGG